LHFLDVLAIHIDTSQWAQEEGIKVAQEEGIKVAIFSG
jgi:hypothetical protein